MLCAVAIVPLIRHTFLAVFTFSYSFGMLTIFVRLDMLILNEKVCGENKSQTSI